MCPRASPVGLSPVYPILNVTDNRPGQQIDERTLVKRAAELASCGCTRIQLRAKDLSASRFVELAVALAVRLKATPATLIVNDRVDIAIAATRISGTAVGVHLGQDDLPIAQARALLGPAAAIGLSTHDVEQVSTAATESVNYIGFGPIFESLTKAGVGRARGTKTLARACQAARIPVVAIGRIDITRAREVFNAGAASVALIHELQTARDTVALVRRYHELFYSLRGERSPQG